MRRVEWEGLGGVGGRGGNRCTFSLSSLLGRGEAPGDFPVWGGLAGWWWWRRRMWGGEGWYQSFPPRRGEVVRKGPNIIWWWER